MHTASSKLLTNAMATHVTSARRERLLRLLALAAIITLAGALRFANLEALGYGNHYYTAAVKSMLMSWHKFFLRSGGTGWRGQRG